MRPKNVLWTKFTEHTAVAAQDFEKKWETRGKVSFHQVERGFTPRFPLPVQMQRLQRWAVAPLAFSSCGKH